MYAIIFENISKRYILCHGVPYTTGAMSLVQWDAIKFNKTQPVLRESATEIDQLMQDYMTTSNFYNLKVYKLTEEEEYEILLSRLGKV